jgi:hypothetical protein
MALQEGSRSLLATKEAPNGESRSMEKKMNFALAVVRGARWVELVHLLLLSELEVPASVRLSSGVEGRFEVVVGVLM